MDLNIKVGIRRKQKITVEQKDTARALGSGRIDVFSTPRMVALMENISFNLIEPFLPEGYSSVGTKLDIVHIASTPIGISVIVEAEIIEVDRKKVVFKVIAWDNVEKIGEGIHERFIINIDKFLEKTHKKLNS